MTARLNTLDLVRALRQTLGNARATYETGLRKMPAGDGPIFILGDGPAHLVAQTGALSFESLAGRPSVVRCLGEFAAYDLPRLRPRTPVVAIRLAPQADAAAETLRVAKRRGAWLMELTNDPGDHRVALADQVLAVPGDDVLPSAAPGVLCAHAAAAGLGLSAALIFKPQTSQHERQLSQFRELPEYLERVFGQSASAIRQMIEEVRQVRRLLIFGCGFSRPVAAQGAAWMQVALRVCAYGGNPAEFPASLPNVGDNGTSIILLCGSSSPHKKFVHELAQQAELRHCPILAVTDGGDTEIVRRARLSLLIPPLPEMVSAVMQLAVMQWMASLAEQARRPSSAAFNHA